MIRTALIAATLVAWAASFAPAGAETILFRDTFNNQTDAATYGAGNAWGLNQEIGNTYRQTGTYANTTYNIGASGVGTPKVNNAIAVPNSAGRISVDKTVRVNHNFNGADAVGGIKISVEIQRGEHVDNGNWLMIGFGYPGSANDPFNAPHGDSGLLFQWNGNANIYKVATGQLGSFNWGDGSPTASPAFSAAKHQIDIYITDSGDSNPFNASGSLVLNVFVDGIQKLTNFNWGADVADNYVWLRDSSVHGGGQTGKYNYADNLTITNLTEVEIPEPSSIVLASLAALGGLFVVRRKAKNL